MQDAIALVAVLLAMLDASYISLLRATEALQDSPALAEVRAAMTLLVLQSDVHMLPLASNF